MKTSFPIIAIAAISLQCATKKSDPAPTTSTPNNTAQQYIATDTSFTNFTTWAVVLRQDSALNNDGRAHTNAPRITWVKQADVQRLVNGQYPTGTIFVKSVSGGYGIVAMVKRNGDFNTANNGWEWFNLNTNGTIKTRYLAPNGCDNCHAKVKTGQDYVFTRQ